MAVNKSCRNFAFRKRLFEEIHMRKILSSIVMASAVLLTIGCSPSQDKGKEKDGADAKTSIMTDEDLEYTELAKVELPCSKEILYTAWKEIGTIEGVRRKTLDYKQNTPSLFISTDLDKDGAPEILLRNESTYAAIFSFVEDSLRLITFVDSPYIGLGITPDGVIMRSGTDRNGSSFTQFIRLKNSQIAAIGETRETFTIKDNEMISGGTKYLLQTDSVMLEVSQEEYKQAAPEQEGTYLEDIDGWEDFRKP